jgi:hypothetical protein
MTRAQIDATLDAIAILESFGAWLELSSVAKQIRVSAWIRLQGEVRRALTSEATS